MQKKPSLAEMTAIQRTEFNDKAPNKILLLFFKFVSLVTAAIRIFLRFFEMFKIYLLANIWRAS